MGSILWVLPLWEAGCTKHAGSFFCFQVTSPYHLIITFIPFIISSFIWFGYYPRWLNCSHVCDCNALSQHSSEWPWVIPVTKQIRAHAIACMINVLHQLFMVICEVTILVCDLCLKYILPFKHIDVTPSDSLHHLIIIMTCAMYNLGIMMQLGGIWHELQTTFSITWRSPFIAQPTIF